MKKKFLLIFACIGLFVNAKEFKREDFKSISSLESIFVVNAESKYDPTDVFGILNFLLQYSDEGKYFNYETRGLSLEDINNMMNGSPDIVLDNSYISSIFRWENGNNGKKVLVEFYHNFAGMDEFIGTLDGKYFINLKSISLKGHKITSINVSNNLKLQNLILTYNPINTLDVSNNLNLRVLDCSYTKLTTLDISNNINLDYLNCSYINLAALDVSKNTKLWELYCENNKITSLDVSKNTLLEKLFCHDNQITQLDILNNPYLLLLSCSGNQLKYLDVSKENNLIGVGCMDNQLKFSTFIHNPEIEIIMVNSQAIIQGGNKGYFELLDLSSEYSINNSPTSYKWYDKATGQEVSLYGLDGAFYASPANAGKKLICKMTNSLFPDWILEYEVTITNNMTENTSARMINTDNLLEGFKLVGPDANTQNISIAPNPVTDILKINSSSPAKSIIVYDYTGREVKRINSITNNQANVQDLPSGIYILNIQTDQGTVTKKMIRK